MNRCCRRARRSAGFRLAMAVALVWVSAWNAAAAPVQLKPVPEITFGNLSPPFTDYDYFQHCRLFPFNSDASAFSLVNAWWLAEAAMLVYADEAYVSRRFRQAGLDDIRFFNRAGTQCFIAANDRFAIVAFRGSEIWKRSESFNPARIVADLSTNIDVRLSEWDRGGKVHSGFKAALDEVWDDLRPKIEELQERGVRVWITGHSLGGALATLAADRLATVQGAYSFGSPRVGDDRFQAEYRPRTFRVVNGRDIVARLPPKGPFYHVGELIPIDRHGRVSFRRIAFGNHTAPHVTVEAEGDEQRRDRGTTDSGFWIPRSIRDHVPLLYAISLWNELVLCRNATDR